MAPRETSGAGGLNDTSIDRLQGDNYLRKMLPVLMQGLKSSLNNKSVVINDGPHLGFVLSAIKADPKDSGRSSISEAFAKNRDITVWKLKVVVPEVHGTACMPLYLPTDTENWDDEDWRTVASTGAEFWGERPVGSAGHDDPVPGDIVAVMFDNVKNTKNGGIYLGKAYNKRKVWKKPGGLKKEAKKALKRVQNDAALSAAYSEEESLIECVPNDQEDIATGGPERICFPAFGKKRCHNELSSSPIDYQIASTDALREQKYSLQKLLWTTSPTAGADAELRSGLTQHHHYVTARKKAHKYYVDPLPLTMQMQLMAYQAICHKKYYSGHGMPKDLATFYDNGTGGIGLESKKIIKRITLPAKYNWIRSPARTFKINRRLELVFRMVFHQIHMLREDGYPGLDKFRIHHNIGFKRVRPVAARRDKDDPSSPADKYQMSQKTYPIKIIDVTAKDGDKGSKEKPYIYPEKISSHSYGLTLDINEIGPAGSTDFQNPMLPKKFGGTTWRTLQEWREVRDVEYGGDEDDAGNVTTPLAISYKIPNVVISVFKAYGFRWGGNFSGNPDIMHFDFVGDPTYILASYINGIIFAIQKDGAGGYTPEAAMAEKYSKKRLIIGKKSDKWNKSLLEYLKKAKISAEGLF